MVMSYLNTQDQECTGHQRMGFHRDLIANAMPVNRFEQILRCIHFVNNYTQETENADMFFKIRPVLGALKKTFHSAVYPE